MKRSRQERTVAEKLELLNRYRDLPPMSQRETAKRLGISRGFLQNLFRDEAALRTADSSLKKVKRRRISQNERVENALFEWFKSMRRKNAPVNGPILKHKAQNIAETIGCSEFVVTERWFSRWKKQYGVTFGLLKTGTDIQEMDEFSRPTMLDILNLYLPTTVDETEEAEGCLPTRLPNMLNKDEKCSDNANGTEEGVPSAAEMRQCLRRLTLGLEKSDFKDMKLFDDVKKEIYAHLEATFPSKESAPSSVG